MKQVRKIKENGGTIFLVSARDTTTEHLLKLKYVVVVKEFLDVLPDENLGISPSREIAFENKLMPEMAPVSKAPF